MIFEHTYTFSKQGSKGSESGLKILKNVYICVVRGFLTFFVFSFSFGAQASLELMAILLPQYPKCCD